VKHRGDELYKKKGDPPKDYAVPQGWVRFALRANHKPTWHVAYHGLKAAHLRRVLDRGQLLPKGKSSTGPQKSLGLTIFSITLGELGIGQKPNKSKSKEDDSDAPQLLFSPTIKFVGSHQLSPPVKYMDNKSGKIYHGQVN
jgi:neuralized-like protein 4